MTYYDILEVSDKASEEVIRMAYKALAKKYHPDLFSGQAKVEAEEKMKQINMAYSILSNDQQRAKYDNFLRSKNDFNSAPKYQQSAQPTPPPPPQYTYHTPVKKKINRQKSCNHICYSYFYRFSHCRSYSDNATKSDCYQHTRFS